MKGNHSQGLTVVSWICSGTAALALAYFVTAPPIMMGIIKRYGFSSEAPGLMFYLPVVRLMESDFGGPLIWYFNRVWHVEIDFFGEVSYGPFHVVVAYLLALAFCIGMTTFPILRRYRRVRMRIA